MQTTFDNYSNCIIPCCKLYAKIDKNSTLKHPIMLFILENGRKICVFGAINKLKIDQTRYFGWPTANTYLTQPKGVVEKINVE